MPLKWPFRARQREHAADRFRVGDHAHPAKHRAPRQNDDRRCRRCSAERHLRVPSRSASTLGVGRCGVSGSAYGSAVGLALVLPTWCILIPLAATGAVKWVLPIGCTIGLLILVPIMRRSSILTVCDDGMTLVQFGKTVYGPWSNVASIRNGTLGASLVFRESQPMGVRQDGDSSLRNSTSSGALGLSRMPSNGRWLKPAERARTFACKAEDRRCLPASGDPRVPPIRCYGSGRAGGSGRTFWDASWPLAGARGRMKCPSD